MTKWISVTWSKGVTESESEILTRTITQTLTRLYLGYPAALEDPPIRVRAFGNWVIIALTPDQPYWGTQWYIDSSYDDDLQRVLALTFLELVRQEPWQRTEPHFDLALLDQDLTDFPAPLARLRPERYTLSSSFPGTSAVMSVHRLRALHDPHLRQLALARLVRHNLGHVLSVPAFTRQEQVARLGLELHCTNTCAMRHAASTEELAQYAQQEAELGWPFCDRCTSELLAVVLKHALLWS